VNSNFGAGTVLIDWLFGYNACYYKFIDEEKVKEFSQSEKDGPSAPKKSKT
jgi:hypothetical protein